MNTSDRTTPRISPSTSGPAARDVASTAVAEAHEANTGPTGTAPTGRGMDAKIHDLDSLARHLSASRNGHRVVHCHGVFDLLHIGHIRHLEAARRLGDLLVVTLTPDRYVNKGPDRPAFPEQLRAQALAALSCVDFVAINAWPRATETIRKLRPNVFVKGAEFRDLVDHSGAVADEAAAVREIGGEIAFTDDITFSSSNLINRFLPAFNDEVTAYLRDLRGRYSAAGILDWIERGAKLRIGVVGEAIIDEYRYCDAIGKSSKEPILAVQQIEAETFPGGILAVGNHIGGLAGEVRLLTAIGRGCPYEAIIREHLAPGVQPSLITREQGPTIVKRRYVDRYFFQKLFEVYEMDDAPLTGASDAAFCQRLEELAATCDLLIVVDFGHGLMNDRAVRIACGARGRLVVNAQSNAGNLGYHTITRYLRANDVSLRESELRLDARDRHGPLEPLVERLGRRMRCDRVVVTRGAQGCLLWDRETGFCHAPSLAVQVRDRMGAGDTFLAVASLAAAAGAPAEVQGFVGNAAAAQAVATVGHRRTIDRGALFKHIECLLK